jgi:hypothetical protein
MAHCLPIFVLPIGASLGVILACVLRVGAVHYDRNNYLQQMPELWVLFLGCNCNPVVGLARASIALHPNRGPAVLTCFHGPVDLRSRCRCNSPPTLISDRGEILQIIDPIQARDVAWLSIPNIPGTPRQLSFDTPGVGERVTAVLPDREAMASVRAITGRDNPQTGTLELDLDTAFAMGTAAVQF